MCLLPEPHMWFNPQGTRWHFLNVSAAFCACLHSSTRHRGEGAPLVENSKPWHVCISYARKWHRLTLRKTEKKVIFVQYDVCCLCDEASTLKCKVLNATHRPWICTLIGQSDKLLPWSTQCLHYDLHCSFLPPRIDFYWFARHSILSSPPLSPSTS